jgi:DNA-binding beta-propeller fold protein YncE
MKKIFILLSIWCLNAQAHPPVGIVCDSKGNIYYSDLQQVWKIEPSGGKSVVVANVHTHQLYMDAQDNLFGQHLIYSGEVSNKYSHYVWRLNVNNKLDTIVPLTDGFFIENYSFARDSVGNMYWVKHWDNKTAMMKTTATGLTTKITDGEFDKVQWILAVNDIIYYVQFDNIYSMNQQGVMKSFVSKINGKGNVHNSIFGLWSDKKGNLYIANPEKRSIQQINQRIEIRTVYISTGGWYPTGGVFDNNGHLLVLEADEKNNIRVIKADNKDILNTSKTKSLKKINSVYLILVIIGFIFILKTVISFNTNKVITAINKTAI